MRGQLAIVDACQIVGCTCPPYFGRLLFNYAIDWFLSSSKGRQADSWMDTVICALPGFVGRCLAIIFAFGQIKRALCIKQVIAEYLFLMVGDQITNHKPKDGKSHNKLDKV